MPRLYKILTGLSIPYQHGTKTLMVNCPFCGDRKHHCGVWIEGRNFSCFKCHRKGSLYRLLNKLTGMTYTEYQRATGDERELLESEKSVAERIKETFMTDKNKEWAHPGRVDLPGYIVDNELLKTYPQLAYFLYERDLDIEFCERAEARFAGPVGKWANRLILPIWDERGIVVTFQARDVTGDAKMKYLNPSGRPIGDWLYWADWKMGGDPLWLVEGIFDVWRMGRSAVCSFGKRLTKRQRTLLIRENPDELIIAWDADAYNVALETGRELANVLARVGIVRLPEGQDPDSLGREKMEELEVIWL